MMNLFLVTAVVGFFIGHFKMRYGGWLPYIVIEGLVVLLVFLTLARVSQDREVFQRLRVTRVYLIFCAYALTAVVRPDIPIFSGLMGYRALLVCPALLFAGFLAFEHPRQLRRVYVILTVLGVVTALVGLYQWQVGPDVVATWGGYYSEFAKRMLWTRLSQDAFVFRAFATFVQPGVFGATMACVMLTALAQMMSPRINAGERVLLAIAFGVMGAGTVVSASRLSIITVVTGAIIMIALKSGTVERAKRLAQSAAVLAATLWIALQFTGPLFFERLQSVGTVRSFFWRWVDPTIEGLRRGLDSPIGIGLGYTSGLPYFVSDAWLPVVDQTNRNIDSGLGAVAQELGIFGVIIYIFFTAMVAVWAVRSWRVLPAGALKDLLLAPAALAVVAVPLVPIANMMMASYPVAIIYWFLIGMLMRAPLFISPYRRAMPRPLAARGEPAHPARIYPSGAPPIYRQPQHSALKRIR
jgi:hypothetical protein